MEALWKRPALAPSVSPGAVALSGDVSTSESKSVSRRPYTPEQVETALLTMAMCGGSVAASKALKEKGINVPARTLRKWRSEIHAERYIELATKYGREIETVIVQRARETILQADEVQRLALEKTREQLEAGKTKDPSTAGRNAATIFGINTDKVLALTDRPAAGPSGAPQTAEAILAKLARLGIFTAVEGTAEEVETTERPATRERDEHGIVPLNSKEVNGTVPPGPNGDGS